MTVTLYSQANTPDKEALVVWKRDETADEEENTPEKARPRTTKSATDTTGQDRVNIGRSVVIKGQLSGSEDLTIEGQVDGKIELREHRLTIGQHGRINAEVVAKSVVVMGQVTGDIRAAEKISIEENGMVEGDVSAPRVGIAEGAHFKGTIDMSKETSASAQSARQESRVTGNGGAKPVKTSPQRQAAAAR